MSGDPNIVMQQAGMGLVQAIQRDDPVRFIECYGQMNEALIRAMTGGTPADIEIIREVAVRSYLAASNEIRVNGLHPDGPSRFSPQMCAALDSPKVQLVVDPYREVERIAMWSHGSRIYRIHPRTQTELIGSVTADTVIPGEVLRHLPHPDAFVWMGRGGPLTLSPSGVSEYYPGFILSGYSASGAHCHLDNPQVASVQIAFIGGGIMNNGMLIPMRHTVSVPMTGYYSLRTMAKSNLLKDKDPHDYEESDVAALLAIAMPILTYLASVGVDIAERKQTKKSQRRNGIAGSAQRYDVGYRVGAALSLSAGQAGRSTNSAGGGGTKAPHIRRGHFHTYRHGEGKALSMVKWIAPIAVNSNRTDPAPIPTIHRVGDRKSSS